MSRRSETAHGRGRPKAGASMWNVGAAVFLFAVAGFLLVSLAFSGNRIDGRTVAATLAVSVLCAVLGSIALFKEGAGAIRAAPD